MNAPKKLRFTIDQYHQMGDAGIIDELVRTELLRGEVVIMPSKGTPHEVYLSRLIKSLITEVGDQAMVRVQSPILLPPDSEPEPDISIIRLRDDEYLESHPAATDVLLALEVSDSSLPVDRGLKLEIYAESGIQNYWIFDVAAEQLEAFSLPFRMDASGVNAGYRTQKIFNKSDRVDIPELAGVQLDLSHIFK